MDQLRNFAIDECIWDETKYIHSDHQAFKRCSVPGMLERLSAIQNLTIVGNAQAGWGDKNENLNGSYYRQWTGVFEEELSEFMEKEFYRYEHWVSNERDDYERQVNADTLWDV